uniref:Clathrin_bdg domain-containing protein n=1 Tax=Syphacia muris TaxID=451379 RepID=A0A0N5ACG3_9BILA
MPIADFDIQMESDPLLSSHDPLLFDSDAIDFINNNDLTDLKLDFPVDCFDDELVPSFLDAECFASELCSQIDAQQQQEDIADDEHSYAHLPGSPGSEHSGFSGTCSTSSAECLSASFHQPLDILQAASNEIFNTTSIESVSQTLSRHVEEQPQLQPHPQQQQPVKRSVTLSKQRTFRFTNELTSEALFVVQSENRYNVYSLCKNGKLDSKKRFFFLLFQMTATTGIFGYLNTRECSV